LAINDAWLAQASGPLSPPGPKYSLYRRRPGYGETHHRKWGPYAADRTALLGLGTLILLEIVLGIDNDKLPPANATGRASSGYRFSSVRRSSPCV